MKKLLRESLNEAIDLNVVIDPRFKTTRLSAVFYMPLSEDTVSEFALLTRVLVRSCEKYPDFTMLSKKLSALYGASLSADCFKSGDRLAVLFSIAGLDDRYAIGREKIFEELCGLLCEIIFRPKLNGDRFDSFEFELGKRELIDMIDSEFNDKRVYALNRSTAVMCEGEAFALSRLGTKDALSKVSEGSLYSAWRRLIEEAKLEIFYVGESKPDAMKSVFSENFKRVKRSPAELRNYVKRRADNVKTVEEEMELSQSKMILGFRCDCAEPESDVTAFRLMSAVLGGTAHSKLFNNVREKLSLCYYCASRYNRSKGIMTVESGVEQSNIEKAKEAILAEIEAIKRGEITDFEMESAKKSMLNSFREMNDTAASIEGWYMSQVFDREFCTADEMCDLISSVSVKDVIKAAEKLTLDTVYILNGNLKEAAE